MTNVRRLDLSRVLAFSSLLLLAAIPAAQQLPPIAQQLAKIYGLDSFAQVEGSRYTFNLDLSTLNLKRSESWQWHPKTDTTAYERKEPYLSTLAAQKSE